MCMLYESLLLFGVLFFTMLLILLLGKQTSPATLQIIKQVSVFLTVGAYFVYFWYKGRGQTLPMKTWRIQLVGADYLPVRWQHAVIRYLLSWLWFLPAMIISHVLGLKPWPTFALLGVGMLAWAMTVFLDPQRQFLHDRLARTRLILLPPFGKGQPQ